MNQKKYFTVQDLGVRMTGKRHSYCWDILHIFRPTFMSQENGYFTVKDLGVSRTWQRHSYCRDGICLPQFPFSRAVPIVLTYFQRLKTGLSRSEDWSTFMDSATPGHIYMLICQKIGRVQCLCNFFLLWGWEWQIPRHAVSTFSGVQV